LRHLDDGSRKGEASLRKVGSNLDWQYFNVDCASGNWPNKHNT